jgi:phosphoenolpyruvate synthase/pyruvate phosphate dikinase
VRPIISFKDEQPADVLMVGGKGASLIKLYQAGLKVPDGFVVTTDAYKEFNGAQISDEFKGQLLKAFDELDAKRVAVRSSAISEDSDSASWAGQFESFMNVHREELVQKLLECWESAKGASSYAETQSLKESDLVLAVVVQKMVDSEVSGVAFSVNPVTHDDEEIMIEATYGLGELLVQGMITPDNYVIKKTDGSIKSERVSVKKTMLVFQDGETKEVPVAAADQEKSCLTPEQLKELKEVVSEVEDYYGSPQDIEWGVMENKFYVLQSRPITTI